MASNLDLRKFQQKEEIQEAFSRLVSGGKSGYKTVIEKKKQTEKCEKCQNILSGWEKFCPECGNKIKEESLQQSVGQN